MPTTPFRTNIIIFLLIFLSLVSLTLACARSIQSDSSPFWNVPSKGTLQPTETQPNPITFSISTRAPGEPILTPTPDSVHPLPTPRDKPAVYIIQAGDTLGIVAQNYGVSLEQVIQANDLSNPNVLEIGQTITVPVPILGSPGPDFKIVPDSELVYSPTSAQFDTEAFIQNLGGYLSLYSEEVNGTTLSGSDIVSRISQNFSVNPRLLLSVLEYQSHWVTESSTETIPMEYPIGLTNTYREHLYLQLAWAANMLNRGYYLWRINGVGTWVLKDGSIVPIAPTINAGTAGVQQVFAQLYERSQWEHAVSERGLFATYKALFGYPFDITLEPILPQDIRQPTLQLPFEPGVIWAFTGGPHASWGSGSAWGALDFAPPIESLGCIKSDLWVVAAGDGLILRADNGAVVQDLDHGSINNDAIEQTGWTILYMHIEGRDRVSSGTYLKAGERIGHPSCEGGISSGTHVHITRRYNGEWIAADQTLPFIMDGWVSRGLGIEYDGYLEREGKKIEAWDGLSPENSIQR